MRWMQRDPIGHAGGVNIWEYANSNPVRYVDPDGLDAAAIRELAKFGIKLHPAVRALGIACIIFPDLCQEMWNDAAGMFCSRDEPWSESFPQPFGGARKPRDRNECDKVYEDLTEKCQQLGSRQCWEEASEWYAWCISQS